MTETPEQQAERERLERILDPERFVEPKESEKGREGK